MLSAEQILHIRQSAVKTWRYFDELVNESEIGFLQTIIRRNLMLALLTELPHKYRASFMSLVSARDLGFKHLEHS